MAMNEPRADINLSNMEEETISLRKENQQLKSALADMENKFQLEMMKKEQEVAILNRQLKRMVENIKNFTSSMILEVDDTTMQPLATNNGQKLQVYEKTNEERILPEALEPDIHKNNLEGLDSNVKMLPIQESPISVIKSAPFSVSKTITDKSKECLENETLASESFDTCKNRDVSKSNAKTVDVLQDNTESAEQLSCSTDRLALKFETSVSSSITLTNKDIEFAMEPLEHSLNATSSSVNVVELNTHTPVKILSEEEQRQLNQNQVICNKVVEDAQLNTWDDTNQAHSQQVLNSIKNEVFSISGNTSIDERMDTEKPLEEETNMREKDSVIQDLNVSEKVEQKTDIYDSLDNSHSNNKKQGSVHLSNPQTNGDIHIDRGNKSKNEVVIKSENESKCVRSESSRGRSTEKHLEKNKLNNRNQDADSVKIVQDKEEEPSDPTRPSQNMEKSHFSLPMAFGKRKRKSSSDNISEYNRNNEAKKVCFEKQIEQAPNSTPKTGNVQKKESRTLSIIDKASKYSSKYYYEWVNKHHHPKLANPNRIQDEQAVRSYLTIAQKNILGSRINLKESNKTQKKILQAKDSGTYLETLEKNMKKSAKLSASVGQVKCLNDASEKEHFVQPEIIEESKNVTGGDGKEMEKLTGDVKTIDNVYDDVKDNDNVNTDNSVQKDKNDENSVNRRIKRTGSLRFDPSVIDSGLNSFVKNMTGSSLLKLKPSSSDAKNKSVILKEPDKLPAKESLVAASEACKNIVDNSGDEYSGTNKHLEEPVKSKLPTGTGKLSFSQYKERKNCRAEEQMKTHNKTEITNHSSTNKVSNVEQISGVNVCKTESKSTASDVMKLIGIPELQPANKQLLLKTQDSIGSLLTHLNCPRSSKGNDDSFNKAAILENNVTHLLDSLVNVQNMFLSKSTVASPMKVLPPQATVHNESGFSRKLFDSIKDVKSDNNVRPDETLPARPLPRDPRLKAKSTFVDANLKKSVDHNESQFYNPKNDLNHKSGNRHSDKTLQVGSNGQIEAGQHQTQVVNHPAGNNMAPSHLQTMIPVEPDEPEMPEVLQQIMSDYASFMENIAPQNNQSSEEIKRDYNETMAYLNVMRSKNLHDENLQMGATAVHEMMVVKLAMAMQREALAMQQAVHKSNPEDENKCLTEMRNMSRVCEMADGPLLEHSQVKLGHSSNQDKPVKTKSSEKVLAKQSVHKSLLPINGSPRKFSIEPPSAEITENADSLLWSVALDDKDTFDNAASLKTASCLLEESKDSLYGDISHGVLNVSASDIVTQESADHVMLGNNEQNNDTNTPKIIPTNKNKTDLPETEDTDGNDLNCLAKNKTENILASTKTEQNIPLEEVTSKASISMEPSIDQLEYTKKQKSREETNDSELADASSLERNETLVDKDSNPGIKSPCIVRNQDKEKLLPSSKYDDERSHGESLLAHDLYVSDISSVSVAGPSKSDLSTPTKNIDENDNSVGVKELKTYDCSQASFINERSPLKNKTKEDHVDVQNKLPTSMFSPLKTFKALLSPNKLQSSMYSPSSKGSSKIDDAEDINEPAKQLVSFQLQFDNNGTLESNPIPEDQSNKDERNSVSDRLENHKERKEDESKSEDNVKQCDCSNKTEHEKVLDREKSTSSNTVEEFGYSNDGISLLPGEDTFTGPCKTDIVIVSDGIGDFSYDNFNDSASSNGSDHQHSDNEAQNEDHEDSDENAEGSSDDEGADETVEEGEIIDSDEENGKDKEDNEEKENIENTNFDLREKLSQKKNITNPKTIKTSKGKGYNNLKKENRSYSSSRNVKQSYRKRTDEESHSRANHRERGQKRCEDRSNERRKEHSSHRRLKNNSSKRKEETMVTERPQKSGRIKSEHLNVSRQDRHNSRSNSNISSGHRREDRIKYTTTRTRHRSGTSRVDSRGNTSNNSHKERDVRHSVKKSSEKDHHRTPDGKHKGHARNIDSYTPDRGAKRRRSSSHERPRKR